MANCTVYHCNVLFFIVLCYVVLYFIPCFEKIQAIRGQNCRCIFCGMQRVVFHSTFAFETFEDFSETCSETFQLLQTFPNSSDHVGKSSDDLRTLPSNSPKISKIIKTLENSFEPFPKISKDFRRFPNTSEDFPKISEEFPKILKLFLTVFENFQIFPNSSKTVLFRKFPQISEVF